MDRLNCGLEVKFSDGAQAGAFDGYASLFGVVDSYNDVVAPGAFKNTLAEMKAQGRSIPMYMQHGPVLGGDPRPVGVWGSIEEDERGLKVAGRVIGLGTEEGKYNYALVKEGAVTGLSIGYKTLKARYGKTASEPRRTLQEIKLFEISLVDNPALANARLDSIKSAQGIKTIREFEEFLRDVGGYSNSAAKAIAAGGFKSNTELRDEDVAGDLSALSRILATIKS